MNIIMSFFSNIVIFTDRFNRRSMTFSHYMKSYNEKINNLNTRTEIPNVFTSNGSIIWFNEKWNIENKVGPARTFIGGELGYFIDGTLVTKLEALINE